MSEVMLLRVVREAAEDQTLPQHIYQQIKPATTVLMKKAIGRKLSDGCLHRYSSVMYWLQVSKRSDYSDDYVSLIEK